MRKCGNCMICCYIGGVKEIRKPAHRLCKYQDRGCSLYGFKQRPKVCSNFRCAWLRGLGTEEDRPDKNNIMIAVNTFNGGTWLFAIELSKDALMKTGKQMVLESVASLDSPMIVVDYESHPPYDKGDRTVIKDSIKSRTDRMRGSFISQLSEDVNLYELVVS